MAADRTTAIVAHKEHLDHEKDYHHHRLDCPPGACGVSAMLKSDLDYCVQNAQACMNHELAWPDFLDNSVKSVQGVLA
jgi:hypothetical protein